MHATVAGKVQKCFGNVRQCTDLAQIQKPGDALDGMERAEDAVHLVEIVRFIRQFQQTGFSGIEMRDRFTHKLQGQSGIGFGNDLLLLDRMCRAGGGGG